MGKVDHFACTSTSDKKFEKGTGQFRFHQLRWKNYGVNYTNMKVLLLLSAIVLVNTTCFAMASAAKLPTQLAGNKVQVGAAGNIGCLFSKPLCDQNVEWCFDDNAFGRCLPATGVIDQNDMYRYELSKSDMHSLEKQMERLFATGYRWGHSYTQCVLQNLLQAFRRGVELDESICLDVQDQDLEGALKAFQEDIDPWNLAFIKFNPSAKNPHSDFADESYRPPKEVSHLPNGEVVTGKELLAKETPQIRIQDRLKQPVVEISASDGHLLEEAIDPYLAEEELANTVAKVKGDNIPKGKNKSGKNKNRNKNKLKNTKKSVLNVEYPGQSDNFNGVDIGPAKKDPVSGGQAEYEIKPVSSINNQLQQELQQELINRKLAIDSENNGIGPDGIVNDRILQPKIFSSFYNTPDSFRFGAESWDEPEQAFGQRVGAASEDFDVVGRDGEGVLSASSSVGGGYQAAPGYGNDDRDHRARQEELRLRQEEEDQQIREAVAKLQAAALLESLIRDNINLEDEFRNAQVGEESFGEPELPMSEAAQAQQQRFPSSASDSLFSSGVADPESLDSYSYSNGPQSLFSDPARLPQLIDNEGTLYTEGGLVSRGQQEDDLIPERITYNNDFGRDEKDELNFLKRFVEIPRTYGDEGARNPTWGPFQLDRDDDGSLINDGGNGYGSEYAEGYGYDYPSPLFLLNRKSRNGFGFERRERLDVKKPGPWYRTVNNYAFDKDDNQDIKVGRTNRNLDVNPEFGAAEGPADMLGSSSQDATNKDDSQLGDNTIPAWRREQQIGEIDKKSAPVKFEKTFPVSMSEFGNGHLDIIDTSYANVFLDRSVDWETAKNLVLILADALDLERTSFKDITTSNDIVTFKVESNNKGWNATEVARQIQKLAGNAEAEREMGIKILRADVGIRANSNTPSIMPLYDTQDPASNQIYLATFAVCGLVAAVLVAAVAIFLIRKHSKSREKLVRLSQDDPSFEACKDYQDLCRARMAGSKNNEKMEPLRGPSHKVSGKDPDNGNTSSRSSTSSWSEEPVLTNMDISTGHMVLSYMEDHLKNRDRMDQEWASLQAYEADPCSTAVAEKSENSKKNRYSNSLPFDHSRVILNDLANVSGSDYVNASTITDHDPRNPAYIATQGPLPNTAADFWQMVWEQGSVVIVNLTRLTENTTALCHRYWPEEGSELHHIYEVHLVSEHIWCDEYLVRSFYLKNLKTGETRTVTQFHFLAWPENGVPQSTKALLEFRRKVNKSYRGRSCPIIVHCSDGAGRTGTYCLIDMVLNRMTKGAKEIDIAASLEHIRDQRPGVVRTKQQFEFVLMAVAEEVHAILKALPQ